MKVLIKICSWCMLIAVCCLNAAAVDLTFAWDPSNDQSVTGYALYFGASKGNYTTRIDAGPSTTTLVPNLTAGQTYFFAVKAYDSDGVESVPSNELTYPIQITIPASQTVLQNSVLSLPVTAVSPYENPTITFSLLSPPTGMIIDPILGVISWVTPPVGQLPVPFIVTVTASDNHTTATSSFTLTVDRVLLTVTANPATRTYGSADPTFSATFTGFTNGETLATSDITGAPAFMSTASAGSGVGAYQLQPTLGTLATFKYRFVFVDSTLTITPAALTIRANDIARTYGALNPPFTPTFIGLVNGDTASVISGQPSFSTGAILSSPVGNYPIAIGVGNLSAANYNFGNFVPGNLAVTPAVLTTTPNNASRTYGAINPTFTPIFSGFVNGENASVISGQPAFNTVAGPLSSVGGYPITVSAGNLSAANYIFGNFGSGILTVNPAPLTVTPLNASRVYGAVNPVFAQTFAGFLNGETSSVISGQAAITSSATPASPVGDYPITVGAGSLSAANYTFSNFGTATLTVTPAVLTVSANDMGRTYGGANPVFTAAFNGLLNGDSTSVIGGSPVFTTVASPSSSVGNYPITIGPGNLSAANYTFGNFIDGTLTVFPAPLTVTPNNASRSYGAANPSFTSLVTGFVNGDTASVILGQPTFSTTATGSSGVGIYPISVGAGTLSAPNYIFATLGSGSLTITPVLLTVTPADASRTYGAANPAFIANFNGFVTGDSASVISGQPGFSTSATAVSPVGIYPITVGAGTLSAANYTFGNFGSSTLTITPAGLTVSANDASRIYGAANPTFTPRFIGLLNGDSAAAISGQASFSTTATSASPVGGYSIVAGPGSLSAANYSFVNFGNGNLTVTPASLTITANNANRVYGGANPTFTPTYSGFVNGDTASVISGQPSLTTTATPASSVGTYPIVAGVGSLSAANYSFGNLVNGNLTINPVQLAVTANNSSRTYGAPNPVFSPNFSGFVNGDTAAVISGQPAFSTIANSASPIGTYPITVAAGTLSAANYTFGNFGSGTLTVNPAVITVTPNNGTRFFGKPNPSFTPLFTGFVNGETSAVITGNPTFSTTADSTSPVGNYPITVGVGTLSAPNYVFGNLGQGILTITPASVTLDITANDATRSYGAANPPFFVTFTGFANGDTAAVVSGQPTLTTTATPASPVGTYPIVVGPGNLSAANYTFGKLANGTLTVTPATITVTANNSSRPYGGANPAFSPSFSGFLNGDTAAVVTGQATFSTSANSASQVGNYPIVVNVGSLHAANYVFGNLVNGTLAVTPVMLSVTAKNATRSYGVTNPIFRADFSGFLNGDSAAVVAGKADFNTTATPASSVGTYPVSVGLGNLNAANYTFGNFSNGNLTVTPAVLTVTANSATRVYGDLDPQFSAQISGFLNNDTEKAIAGEPTFSTTASIASPVGSYSIAPGLGSLVASNYTFGTFVNGTLSVTPASLTVSPNNVSRVYGDQNPVFIPKFTGFVNGDGPSVVTGQATFVTAATPLRPIGTYPIKISAGSLAADNYTFDNFLDGIITITPAPLTAIANNASRLYGTANPVFKSTFTGFVNGDSPSVVFGQPTFSSSANPRSPIGNYAITVRPDGLSAANYYFQNFIDGNLAVTPAPLTVTTDDKSREFGNENPLFTGNIGGLQNNDSITASYTTDALKTSPVGRYVIDVHLIDPNGRLSNYIVTQIDGILTITKPITETLAFAPAGFDNQTFSLSIQSVVGVRYSLQSTDSLTDPLWTIIQTVTGDGGPIIFTDPAADVPNRYYRILIQQ